MIICMAQQSETYEVCSGINYLYKYVFKPVLQTLLYRLSTFLELSDEVYSGYTCHIRQKSFFKIFRYCLDVGNETLKKIERVQSSQIKLREE